MYAQEIAERLVGDGHAVQVLTTDAKETDGIWRPGKSRIDVTEECINGVHVRRLPLRHLPFSPYSYYALRRAAIELSRVATVPEHWLWLLAKYTPWVQELDEALLAMEGGFDLVHGMSIPFESLMYSAFGCAQRNRVPFMATPFIHLGDEGSDRVRRFYTMRHQVSLLRNGHAVFTLTPLEKKYLVGRGVPAHKVHAVGAGVNMSRLAGGEARRFRDKFGIDRPFAFYLGAVAFEKGAVHTVEAMRRLWAQGFGADLVLAGTPFDHFARYFDHLPERDKSRCHLLGAISDQDKLDLLACGDVMVMPSRTESFGIAYLEAWAYEKPVIGARAGAVPDVIDDGVDGYLVPFGDVAAIAQGVERLLSDRDQATRLGRSGRAKVEKRYTWDKVYARVAAVYEEVAGRRT
ncbi:MAG: glycosyltransferase family 4 protein [Chloroflexi bacterium]|nr:glycosyltransferase family 4 protein [Chloroflexota bacterium]